MAAGDFVTDAEVKIFLGGSTDTRITALIPVIQSLVHDITNNSFITTGTTVYYPASLKLPVTRYIGYLLGNPAYPSNWKRGDVSVQEDSGFKAFLADLTPWKLAKFI
jgi:hypothetical protein